MPAKPDEEIKSLFIVGHKRSGTTLLMHLLNFHPEVFISDETDIIWILYQFYYGKPFKKYRFDGDMGMNQFLSIFGKYVDPKKSVAENFVHLLARVMKKGFIRVKPMNKPTLKYIGDKKPFQNADPEIVDFCISQISPLPKYIHIIRHPLSVVRSCQSFGPDKDGGWMWKGLTGEEILNQWLIVENWIFAIKKKIPEGVLDVRYEDLLENPSNVMKRIQQFLNLDFDTPLMEKIKNKITPGKKEMVKLTLDREIEEVLNHYGYEI